jgi:predicted DNA-binding protein (MmcQ/YjbR family)
VWGYVQPIYAGEYAFIHKWNAFSALFLTLLVAPCYLSFAKLMAVLLYAAAFFFQQGLPLPRRRFSTESFSNSISLRLFNALAFVPLAMTGEELAYLLMLIFFVLPPYFAQLMLDYGRLIDGLSAQERTERMLRQSVPARALYRRDDDYDDEAETGVLGKIYHMRRRLSDKLWDYLQQWDQLYDDLEEEERAAPGYYSAEERPWLERGDSDDELDPDDENDAAVAEPSNRAQRPQPRATARGRPPARRPGRTATASRPINPRSVSARYDPVINPQQDPEDPAHALGFIIDEPLYARDWDEALLDTASELIKDISGFVWGTMEALVGSFLAIIVAYYVYCLADFVVYRVWGIHLPDNAPVLALFGYLKSFWAGVVSWVGIRRIVDGVWGFRLKDTALWRSLVRSLTWVSDGTVRRE